MTRKSILFQTADQVEKLRINLLFGDASDDLDDLEGTACAHYVIALSLLEQARQHLILAHLAEKDT